MNDSRAVDTVWVRGRAIERRKRSLVLACLNATLNECRLILPRSQLSGERDCRADPAMREFCVPAWWARAASVPPATATLNDVDYSALELRVMASADAILADGTPVWFKTTAPGPDTGRRREQFDLYQHLIPLK